MSHEISLKVRAPHDVVERQIGLVKNQQALVTMLDGDPSILLVLNQFRQIVYTNQALLTFLKLDDSDCVFGKRPGEVLDCEHATEQPDGCGTTEFCQTCGALNAILASQKGNTDIQECRIVQKETGEALDLRVWTTPLFVDGDRYTIFALHDISHEKRRVILERIFFHDILNTAGNLRNYAVLLKSAPPEEVVEFAEDIQRLSEGLIDEIQSQRDITRAENGDLVVKPVSLKPAELIEEIASLYKRQESVSGIKLLVTFAPPEIELVSDLSLLRRILLNMVKNAFEACQSGDTIQMGYSLAGEQIVFRVHNPSVMPAMVRLQIFQRSFSTKGAGRGLGTYSIKLLGERYLGGKVTFHSEEGKGTEFTLAIPINNRAE